jgi:hypothetical protein
MHSKEEEADLMEHIEVSVWTPDGTWPTEGFFEVPAQQKIALLLEHVRRSLKIENTDNWVAVVEGRALDPATSYRKNGLAKRVSIFYGLSRKV